MTPLKLSEAMRLGAMIRPQRHGAPGIGNGTGCALEAAMEAVGLLTATALDTPVAYDVPYAELREAYPFLRTPMGCIACRWGHSHDDCCNVSQIIWHLNDIHEWTREQIADWIATIEPQDAETQTVEQSRPVAKQSERLLATCI